jgi:PKD repeat protein
MDGELIMCGYSFYTNLANAFIKGSKDIWVFKTDGVGNLVWQKTYGGPKDEYPADVVEGEPDWFYVVGTKENTFTNKGQSNKEDIWLLKIKETPCNDMKPMFVTDIHGNQTEVDVPIKFINQSVNCERFLWEFGDGTTSTEKMPVKIYKKSGMYLPRLTAYTNEKCIQVYVSPKAVIIQ